ncbi:MAG: WbqC family protein, partial [Candidatus Eremiobacteraeota bacterium]|nr:WbqC family protein [Candidatus Eremiobacteraeota bacterium]
IAQHFGAKTYRSGVAAQSYLDVDLFGRNGIDVDWQAYNLPAYAQLHEPFVSHMSSIDALLNLGPDARKLLKRR